MLRSAVRFLDSGLPGLDSTFHYGSAAVPFDGSRLDTRSPGCHSPMRSGRQPAQEDLRTRGQPTGGRLAVRTPHRGGRSSPSSVLSSCLAGVSLTTRPASMRWDMGRCASALIRAKIANYLALDRIVPLGNLPLDWDAWRLERSIRYISLMSILTMR